MHPNVCGTRKLSKCDVVVVVVVVAQEFSVAEREVFVMRLLWRYRRYFDF